jgi:hypothetical protein
VAYAGQHLATAFGEIRVIEHRSDIMGGKAPSGYFEKPSLAASFHLAMRNVALHVTPAQRAECCWKLSILDVVACIHGVSPQFRQMNSPDSPTLNVALYRSAVRQALPFADGALADCVVQPR